MHRYLLRKIQLLFIALFFVINLIINRSAFLARFNNLCSSEKNFTVDKSLNAMINKLHDNRR